MESQPGKLGKTASLSVRMPSTEEIGSSLTLASSLNQDLPHLQCRSLNSWENDPFTTLEL